MPQRGYGPQIEMQMADATALRFGDKVAFFTRVAEAATLGWRPLPRWGITENTRPNRTSSSSLGSVRSLNLHPGPIERCCPTESVYCQIIRYIVNALAGVLLRYLDLNASAVMSPSMRNAYHAGHHFLGNLDGHHDSSHP